jgi:glutamine cyclotransferase
MGARTRTAARTALRAASAALVLLGGCEGKVKGSTEGGETDTMPPPQPAPTAAVSVVSQVPHDTAAFTQGLAFHDGALFESTGQYGRSSLRRLDPETGAVLKKVDLGSQYFAEGLATLGRRLYQLTWREQTGLVYDAASLAQVGTFSYDGEGWGLTANGDGTALILSDGSERLRFLDPSTFAVTRTLEVTDAGAPVTELNELEWVRGELWANIWKQDRIARIDPQTGRVKGWLDVSALLPPDQRLNPEAVPNGIAYDPASNHLYVTGKLWPAIFRIRLPEDLPGASPPAPADTAGKQ